MLDILQKIIQEGQKAWAVNLERDDIFALTNDYEKNLKVLQENASLEPRILS